MTARRIVLAVLILLAGVPAVIAADAAPAPAQESDSGRLLYVTEGNRLRRIDLDSVGTPRLVEDVLVPRASQGGRDINGQICPLPDGSGGFVAGEDSNQPTPPAGWGVFDVNGTQIGKLTATYNVAGAEPHGCAFAPGGTLFTSEVGFQGFGTANGQLIMWFPPYNQFPGPPGAYPATNEHSDNFCKLATDIGTAGGVTVDDQGRVYVASSSGLQILRFSPPFPTAPNAAGGCGATDALGSPMADPIQREIFAVPDGPAGMLTFSGLAMAPNGNLYAASVLTGRIAEYDLNGNLLRVLVAPPETIPPVSTGNPQGIAVGPDGTIYYADLDLVGTLPNVGPGPNGKVWRVRFDTNGDPLPPEIVRDGLAFPDGVQIFPGDLETSEWRDYGGGPERQFFNAGEQLVTRDTVPRLRERWRFPTGAIVTASPTVANVTVAGGTIVSVVYVQSWDGNVYAIRLSDGSELWRFATDPQPGSRYPGTASVEVVEIDGVDRVFVAAGQTMYSLDAATGAEVWHFNAGTGCRDASGNPPGLCALDNERNEIETSAIVTNDAVHFGMDVDDSPLGKGGFFSVDVRDGRLEWFFDLESGQTCRPDAADDIRRFDGYHTEAELGLPAGFLSTRSGCDFARDRTGCANVWSSPAFDEGRGLLYFGSSNCDTDNDPATSVPAPPMPPYDEALVALGLDGTPAWKWRPREVDNADLAFGATPNLFSIDVAGQAVDVVGIGNKDGTYYTVDRDGVNEASGVAWDDADPSQLPYWRRTVVPGGSAGGIVGTPAVDQASRRLHFATAPGTNPLTPQQPTIHTLDLDTGDIVWQQGGTTFPTMDASFAPTSAVPGVMFAGSIVSPTLRAYDTATGAPLLSLNIGGTQVPSAVASGAAVVDGNVVVGTGVGARSSNPNSSSELASRVPSAVVALCVSGAIGCPAIVPAPPTGVSVTPGPASATVSWDAPADDGGSDVTRFTVTATPGGANVVVGPEVSSATVPNLDPTQQYTFRVTATNVVGTSAPSAPSPAVTPLDAALYRARFSAQTGPALAGLATGLGVSLPEMIQWGVAGLRAVAEQGGATPIAQPPANTGPYVATVAWPVADGPAIEAAAAAWGVSADQLHHVAAKLVAYLVLSAIAGGG